MADWARFVLTTIGAAAVGALATIWTGAFGYWNTDRGQDIQMVNIALSILGGENKDSSIPGRKFALRVLEKYAEVEIPETEFEQWATVGTLPASIYRPGSPQRVGYSGSIHCNEIPATFVSSGSSSVSISESEDKCVFSVDGATKVAAECPTVPAVVLASTSVSVNETGGHCVFNLSRGGVF